MTEKYNCKLLFLFEKVFFKFILKK